MQDEISFYLDMEPGFNLVNEQTSLKGGVSKKATAEEIIVHYIPWM